MTHRGRSKRSRCLGPTRRELLKATAAAGTALAVGEACSGGESDPLPSAECATPPDRPPFDEIPQGQVALVRADTPQAAVARGVALMNGLSFIEPCQTVLLKPNLTGPFLIPPDTTSPEVLVELIAQCKAAGAASVIVAERVWYQVSSDYVVDIAIYEGNTKSMRQYIEQAGATFLSLDDEPWVEVHPAGAVDFEEPLLVSAALDEVDHVINVPALKTHNEATFTMCMKNLFGCVHPDTRLDQVHFHPNNDTDPGREKRMFAQMNLAFSPVLNVMDAIVSRTTGGPTPPGDIAETNMVLLGRDRVAMDAVGLAVLRHYGTETWIEDRPVWEQVQLAEAVRCGVGVDGPEAITLVGDGVDEIDEIDALLREV